MLWLSITRFAVDCIICVSSLSLTKRSSSPSSQASCVLASYCLKDVAELLAFFLGEAAMLQIQCTPNNPVLSYNYTTWKANPELKCWMEILQAKTLPTTNLFFLLYTYFEDVVRVAPLISKDFMCGCSLQCPSEEVDAQVTLKTLK